MSKKAKDNPMKILGELEFPVTVNRVMVTNNDGEFVDTKFIPPVEFKNELDYVLFTTSLKDCFDRFLGQNITVEAK